MGKKILIFILFVFLAILQTSFLTRFFPGQLVPSLPLLAIMLLTIRFGFERSWKIAVVAGIISDLVSFLPIGTSIFSFAIVAFGVSSLSKRFLVSQSGLRFLILLGIIFAGFFVDASVSIFLRHFFGSSEKMEFSSFVQALWLGLRGVAVFFILYWPIKKAEKFWGLSGQKIIVKRN